jgi:hypothetical protein
MDPANIALTMALEYSYLFTHLLSYLPTYLPLTYTTLISSNENNANVGIAFNWLALNET